MDGAGADGAKRHVVHGVRDFGPGRGDDHGGRAGAVHGVPAAAGGEQRGGGVRAVGAEQGVPDDPGAAVTPAEER